MTVNEMLAYYDKKEAYQAKFKALEKEMQECLRTCNTEKLKAINDEYEALTKEFKENVKITD